MTPSPEGAAPADALGRARALRREGRNGEALALLRARLPQLDPSGVAQAGRLIAKELPALAGSAPSASVLILGQCTTTYLPPLVSAWGWAEGLAIAARDGGHDQVLQDLMGLDQSPGIVILLPWHQRLLGAGPRSAVERVEDELAFFQQAWAQIARLGAKLIQVGFDWSGPGPAGYARSGSGGDIALVRQANDALRSALPPGSYWVDLDSISGGAGRRDFYDNRNHQLLRQPFSAAGMSLLARHLAVAARVLTCGRRKVLVLDLDNTLWGGVVGEAGPHGIVVGDEGAGGAFAAFQRHVRALRESGVLLAVCSKNNDEDARAPFLENARLPLKLEDFSAFHASWDPKPDRLRAIAQELNLGLDSLVFFDDNPAEREHVRALLPEVTVIEVPADPADYIRALEDSLAFETPGLTEADAQRAGQYAAEAERRRVEATAANPGEYLDSLGMSAIAEPIGPANLDRVLELITKTNQFNLTTRRHSRAALEAFLATPGSVSFAVRLADRFGDYGLVSVLIAVPAESDPEALRIDTWLMSCRAMGRTVEHWVMNRLAAEARAAGWRLLLGEYLPTPKNVPVARLLEEFGFAARPGDGLLSLELSAFSDLPAHVSGR